MSSSSRWILCTGCTASTLITLSTVFDPIQANRQLYFEQDDEIQPPSGWRILLPVPNECDIAFVEWADLCHTEMWIHHDPTVNSSWSAHWAGPFPMCENYAGDPLVFDLEGDGFSFTDANTEP